jgi:hypothetical protein
MTTDKRGISALLLQRQLGLRRYETAWMMLHKLRRAMVNAAREPLHGEVEVMTPGSAVPSQASAAAASSRAVGLCPSSSPSRSENTLLAASRCASCRFQSGHLDGPDPAARRPGTTVYTDGLGRLRRSPGGGVRPRPSQTAAAIGPPQGCPVGGAAGRPCSDWEAVGLRRLTVAFAADAICSSCSRRPDRNI